MKYLAEGYGCSHSCYCYLMKVKSPPGLAWVCNNECCDIQIETFVHNFLNQAYHFVMYVSNKTMHRFSELCVRSDRESRDEIS